MRLDEYNERRKEIIAKKMRSGLECVHRVGGLDKQNSYNLSDNI